MGSINRSLLTMALIMSGISQPHLHPAHAATQYPTKRNGKRRPARKVKKSATYYEPNGDRECLRRAAQKVGEQRYVKVYQRYDQRKGAYSYRGEVNA